MARDGSIQEKRKRFRRQSIREKLILFAVIGVGLWVVSHRLQDQTPLPAEGVEHHVTRAIDGDTLLLEDGTRIRLLGVNTPETKHPNRPPEPWGKEASEWVAKRVNGKIVRLEFDRERYDDYKRTLAYVYVDGTFLNEEIIRAGFSAAHNQYPFRSDMKRRFRKAEAEAQNRHLGIWSDAQPQSTN